MTNCTACKVVSTFHPDIQKTETRTQPVLYGQIISEKYNYYRLYRRYFVLFCFFFSWRKKSLDSQLGVLKRVARSTEERSYGCWGGREALARCETGVKAHSIACQCRHSAVERTFILSLKNNGALNWPLGFCAEG